MTQRTTFETNDAAAFGGISRDKNTRRAWVSPAQFAQIAVTGTWALEANSDVASLATDDASTTNVFNIPFTVPFSDLITRGSANVNRGVQIVGLEIIYQVAVSNLASVAGAVFSLATTAIGTPTATAVTSTTTFDTGDATGLTQVLHRMKVSIAEKDRFFLDSGKVVFGKFSAEDGTSSDVNIIGACWHYRFVEE